MYDFLERDQHLRLSINDWCEYLFSGLSVPSSCRPNFPIAQLEASDYWFHSNNLYQIYAYIKNYKNENNKIVEGILLYPTTKQDIDSNHTIGGHNFRLMTVNLNQEWRNIERDLISIIN